ncbi:putative orfan [Tupanvirus soda lake]|uniref:Orfan n=2 Tax=Tupanvirus TaxID=2094720 RepID=A0AC62AAJ3_9VIRU|nr:putative orfan [Tupanvirus soda lake]QKU34795.1 putative orfan [Tupanvirus soda lake]
MTGTAYTQVCDEKLYSHLKTALESQVNELYEKIKKYLLEHGANKGRTELKIFFPITNTSTTFKSKDIIVHQFYDSISDEFIQYKLYKKFKSEGVKLIIDTAYCKHDQYNTYPLRKTGLIFHFKWRKDYSKKSCLVQ